MCAGPAGVVLRTITCDSDQRIGHDRVCHFIRLGYVIDGAVTYRIGERTETYSAGDAYYVPPGHVPIQHEGARLVEFSPTEELGQAIAVVMANVERGRTPLQLSSRT